MIPANLNFLVVDDFETVRTIVKKQLKDFGFDGEVYEAEDVASALKILGEKRSGPGAIQMILSDWNMPGDTGLSFLETVRNSPEFQDIPFILITTENEKTKIVDAVLTGVTQYLVKPWKPEDLKEKLEKAWEKHNG